MAVTRRIVRQISLAFIEFQISHRIWQLRQNPPGGQPKKRTSSQQNDAGSPNGNSIHNILGVGGLKIADSWPPKPKNRQLNP
jgi:hypothetical protein